MAKDLPLSTNNFYTLDLLLSLTFTAYMTQVVKDFICM